LTTQICDISPSFVSAIKYENISKRFNFSNAYSAQGSFERALDVNWGFVGKFALPAKGTRRANKVTYWNL
jgi:hypothetical protein